METKSASKREEVITAGVVLMHNVYLSWTADIREMSRIVRDTRRSLDQRRNLHCEREFIVYRIDERMNTDALEIPCLREEAADADEELTSSLILS